ncbi:MAG: DNA repair protein RecN [Dysgonamonadaceae bacterium]|jgi:DNA repair protein RecN (Recombination protein N)|nr:DNA repair protein RecN [Dysgonamonadaceae bacterium]
MLKSLKIQNYALISLLEINFPSGFSVITGETGAGKSIMLGALSLILGQRSDAKYIKQNEDKCLIEGVFDISSYQLKSFFAQKEWEYDTQTCILRREIWSSGKSRAFINDSPVGLNDLKELGAFLIDIHSQHQNLLLADNHFQLNVLDVLAKNKDLKNEYNSAYKEYNSVKKQFKELKEKINCRTTEEDYIRFQFKQLDEARLRAGEQIELEQEAEMLSNVETIKSGLYGIEQLLSMDETGILSSLKESLHTAQSIRKVYAASEEFSERIETAYLDLKDLAMEIHSQQENLDFNPERLQEVNSRLDLIYSLQKKHHLDSVEALIDLRDSLDKQIRAIDNYDDELSELEKKLNLGLTNVLNIAEKLTGTRKDAAAILEKQLIEKISVLGMPNMRFSAELSQKEHPDSTGKDEVVFLFSANKNGELKPAAQTASGGEISRLMLGIKALIAGATALPAIIFDEIDTGVSGEIADKMGDIMRQTSGNMQVIAITHLPQIAAKGDSQFLVYKKDSATGTESNIRQLSQEERIKEIAQMLSGSKLTDAAIENAKELLKHERK